MSSALHEDAFVESLARINIFLHSSLGESIHVTASEEQKPREQRDILLWQLQEQQQLHREQQEQLQQQMELRNQLQIQAAQGTAAVAAIRGTVPRALLRHKYNRNDGSSAGTNKFSSRDGQTHEKIASAGTRNGETRRENKGRVRGHVSASIQDFPTRK